MVRKEYLICIDSDGCAMDTMNSKHEQCFGPAMIEIWGLEDRRGGHEVLEQGEPLFKDKGDQPVSGAVYGAGGAVGGQCCRHGRL